MQQVKLIAKSKKGKDRIRQHGDIYKIVEDGLFRGEPALSLQSLNKTFHMGGGKMICDGRWVLKTNDPDFSITYIE